MNKKVPFGGFGIHNYSSNQMTFGGFANSVQKTVQKKKYKYVLLCEVALGEEYKLREY